MENNKSTSLVDDFKCLSFKSNYDYDQPRFFWWNGFTIGSDGSCTVEIDGVQSVCTSRKATIQNIVKNLNFKKLYTLKYKPVNITTND